MRLNTDLAGEGHSYGFCRRKAPWKKEKPVEVEVVARGPNCP